MEQFKYLLKNQKGFGFIFKKKKKKTNDAERFERSQKNHGCHGNAGKAFL